MLGNDVVDFSVDEEKYLNQRFINRILCQAEIQHLSQSSHANAFLWSLWAAKEASYKAVQKIELKSIFSPSQFCIDGVTLRALLKHDFQQPLQGVLTFQNQTIQISLQWPTPHVVHCVAYIGHPSLDQTIQTLVTNHWDDDIDNNQSSQVRAVAQSLFQQNNISAQIVRPMIAMSGYTKPGPPILVKHNNQLIPHEISLSHDGQWLAVALLCRP